MGNERYEFGHHYVLLDNKLDQHIHLTNNPHKVDATQIGLGKVTNMSFEEIKDEIEGDVAESFGNKLAIDINQLTGEYIISLISATGEVLGDPIIINTDNEYAITNIYLDTEKESLIFERYNAEPLICDIKSIFDTLRLLSEKVDEEKERAISEESRIEAKEDAAIEAESERAKEVESQLDQEIKAEAACREENFNNLSAELETTNNHLSETDGHLEDVKSSLDDEYNRAVEKENEISDRLSAEEIRAKTAEKELDENKLNDVKLNGESLVVDNVATIPVVTEMLHTDDPNGDKVIPTNRAVKLELNKTVKYEGEQTINANGLYHHFTPTGFQVNDGTPTIMTEQRKNGFYATGVKNWGVVYGYKYIDRITPSETYHLEIPQENGTLATKENIKVESDRAKAAEQANTTAISAEVTRSTNKDLELQEQINTITASSDVVDVVESKEKLDNYDTSKIHENDIVKVLKDETRSNAITYYRWSKLEDQESIQWNYLGEVGPYYTTSETDNLLNRKADLGEDGKILDEQLPDWVNDVIAFNGFATTQTILDTNKKYFDRRSGETFHKFIEYKNDAWVIYSEPTSGKLYSYETGTTRDRNLYVKKTSSDDIEEISQGVQLTTKSRESGEGEESKAYPASYGAKNYNDIVALQNKINLLNIEKGLGENSVQQKQDGTGGTFDFTGKNPNATTLDSTLTGELDYGAVGNFSASFGGKGQASGKRSFQVGTTTIAKGNYSFASGDNSVALGNDSSANNYQTVAAGTASFSTGYSTQVTGTAGFVSGTRNKVDGGNAAAFGSDNNADHNNQFVTGYFNNNKIGTLFEIGNGSDNNNRSNAFEVYEDGTVVIPEGTKGIKIGNTVLDEEKLNKLLALLDAMEA